MSTRTTNSGYRFRDCLEATSVRSPGDRQAPHPYTQFYIVPTRSAPQQAMTRKLHELVRWTSWSTLVLAQVIGSTQPAIARALHSDLEAFACSTAQRQRLDDTYAVVSRVFVLADRDFDRTAQALETPGGDGVTATDRLIGGQPTKAYLVAMRVLRPTRSGDMIIGSDPLDPRRRTAAALDED